MTTCLGKSCSFGFVRAFYERLFVCVLFSCGFEGGVLDLIVMVPDHCPSFCFYIAVFFLLLSYISVFQQLRVTVFSGRFKLVDASRLLCR